MLTCGRIGYGVGNLAGYSTAAANTMVIGNALGKLTEAMYASTKNKKLKSFCIGHSLGSHVCGFTGKTKKLDGILGVDPAGPIFYDNSKDARLNKGDAKFVQALHMDAGELGIDIPVADEDIYVNGGKDEPFCKGWLKEAVCSHSPFSLNFVPKIWEQGAKGNICHARIKCKTEVEAMVSKVNKELLFKIATVKFD